MAVHLKALIEAENRRRKSRNPRTPTLTQGRLAQELGTGVGLLSRHANGQIRMRYESALRYARYFGVHVAEVDDRFSDAR